MQSKGVNQKRNGEAATKGAHVDGKMYLDTHICGNFHILQIYWAKEKSSPKAVHREANDIIVYSQ